MKKPVLIVIDMLKDFLDTWDRSRRDRLVASINELVANMRRLQLPVIWVRQEFEPDLRDAFAEMRAQNIRITIKGTPGCEMVPEVTRDSSDRVIVKKRYSAFFGTELDDILRQLEPDAVVLAGINSHACIRTTAIDAYQRDWAVILAVDCIDSYDREHHDISLKYMKEKIAGLMTNEEIRASLSCARGQ